MAKLASKSEELVNLGDGMDGGDGWLSWIQNLS